MLSPSFQQHCHSFIENSHDPRCLNNADALLTNLLKGRDQRSAIEGLLKIVDSKIPEGQGLIYNQAIASPDFESGDIETFLFVYPEFQSLDPAILEIVSGLRKIAERKVTLDGSEIASYLPQIIERVRNRIRSIQRAAALATPSNHSNSDRFSSRHIPKPSGSRPSRGQRAISQELRALRDEVGNPGFQTKFHEVSEQARRNPDPVIISQLLMIVSRHHKSFPNLDLLLTSAEIGSLLSHFLELSPSSQSRAMVANCLGRLLIGHTFIEDICAPLVQDQHSNIRDLTDALWGLARLEVGQDVAVKLLEAFVKKSGQCQPPDETTQRCLSLSAWSGCILQSPQKLVQELLMLSRASPGRNHHNVVQSFHAAIDTGTDVDYWKEEYLRIRSLLPQSDTPGRTEQVCKRWIETSFPNIPGTVSTNRFYYGFECDVLVETSDHVLNIEIDGSLVHNRLRLHDAFRDRVLQKLGVRVIRLNEDSARAIMSRNGVDQDAVLDKLIGGVVRELFTIKKTVS